MQALIKNFNGSEVTMRQVNGRWGMTAEQFGDALGYADARRNVLKLIRRNADEVSDFLGVVNLSTPGGTQETTIIFDQGILLLAMHAGTDRAKAFRRWVADLLIDLQRGEKQAVDSEVLAALLDEVRRLREEQAKPVDPKTMIAASIAANITGFCPSVQQIIVTTALALPPEPQSIWTATHIKDELARMGIEVSAQKIGKVAKAYGIQCSNEEGENEYGYWAATSVNSFAKVVPQFQYRKPGRDRLIAILTQAHAGAC